MANEGWIRPPLPLPRSSSHGGHERVPSVERPIPGAEIREARESPDDHDLHSPERSGDVGEGAAARVLT